VVESPRTTAAPSFAWEGRSRVFAAVPYLVSEEMTSLSVADGRITAEALASSGR
jgi:hypothetical protein